MALRFPRKKVALDIVSDTTRPPQIVRKGGWTVLRVSNAQVESPQAFRTVMHTLAGLLESSAPSQPDWEENNARLRESLLAHQRQQDAS